MSLFGGFRSFLVGESSGSEDEEDSDQEFSVMSFRSSAASDSFTEPSVWEPSVWEESSVAAPAMSVPVNRAGPYQARADDSIDVAVADFFRNNPQAYTKNSSLTRVRPGMYCLHGRMIEIAMQSTGFVGLPPNLIVKDGPLKQLLADYLENKEDDTAEYSGSVFQAKGALQTIPQSARMTFHDTGTGYSRKEAMMVAKEQAQVREKAATALKDGQMPLQDLQSKYAKSISMKLGKNRGYEDAMSFATIGNSGSHYSSANSHYVAFH